ncbi:MAG: DUF4388 domain-containing protein [Proteobacteria bacterium]|nr:DUF4388 domain-containing protein [Pseudomonadota bacterium]
MPLQGNIESFGISEIFQLISHQGKTGTLEIHTGEGLARVRFLEGNLLEAWPDRRTPAEYIGSLLVRTGLVTSAQLDHALDVQRQSLRRLGDILLRMGALRIAEFQDVLALQHRETAYRLLRLKRGSFRFVPESVDPEEGVSVPMDVGELLMEGFRQLDEWPKLLERIPSERQVYGRAPEPEGEANLNRAESRVFQLLDGTLTVRELVDRARLGEFAGWEALAGLYERGLISPLGAARRARVEPKPTRPSRLPDVLLAAALGVMATALVGLFADQGLQPLVRLLRSTEVARAEAAQVIERGRLWGREEPKHWPGEPW